MRKFFIQFFVAIVIALTSFHASASTDPYYATGEDLDFLIESDNSYALEEIEYELRKYVIFRKVEDYLFNLSDSIFEIDE